MGKIAAMLVVCAVVGCGGSVTEQEQLSAAKEPNGFCEANDECAETDFCLTSWCYSEAPNCDPVNRCMEKEEPGTLCLDDSWCASGTCQTGGTCL